MTDTERLDFIRQFVIAFFQSEGGWAISWSDNKQSGQAWRKDFREAIDYANQMRLDAPKKIQANSGTDFSESRMIKEPPQAQLAFDEPKK